jgi:hypothetical protein
MKQSKWILYLGLLTVLSACGQAKQVAHETSTLETSPTQIETFTAEASALPEPQISLQSTGQVLLSDTPTTIPLTLPPAPDPTVVPLAISVNKAALSSETIPDGTAMQKNQTFTKTWVLKNVGSETWDESYSLELLSAKSSSLMDAPLKVLFGKPVKPGDSIELSIDLIAPQNDGSYTVTYRVLDERGFDVAVGQGNNIWLTIVIGQKAVIQNSTALDPAGVSFSLGKIGHNGDVTSIQVLSSFSTREYSIQPVPTLIVDGKQVAFAGGVDDWQVSGDYSYLWQYAISEQSFNNANSITLVFDTSIRKNLWGNQIVEACLSALSRLQKAYPGISFGCNPAMGGYPYDSLKVPSGLTRSQAHQLVMDAIESASYGRWEVKIR